MKILVTGGAGFVGSNLVDGLLVAGHEVRIFDNFSTGHRANIRHVADDIEVVEGDLRSYERVSSAIRGCEAVFHEGAMPSVPRSVQDPLTSSEINVSGTLNVLLAARDGGVRRVVFASSSSVYGDAPGFPRKETQATSPLEAAREEGSSGSPTGGGKPPGARSAPLFGAGITPEEGQAGSARSATRDGAGASSGAGASDGAPSSEQRGVRRPADDPAPRELRATSLTGSDDVIAMGLGGGAVLALALGGGLLMRRGHHGDQAS